MECLVTGATGFLAGHLLRRLAARGERPRALTRPGSKIDGIAALPVRLYVAAPADGEALRTSLERVEVLFHTAAAVDFWSPESAIFAANRDYPLRLYRLAREAGVRRFVFTSTVGVFGGGFRDVPEDAPLCPLSWSPYERAKAEAEAGLRRLAADGGPELAIVRPGYIMGEGDTLGLVPGLLTALRGGYFALVDGGRAVICPSYAGDVAEVHLRAALHPRVPDRAYHATDGTHTTLRELAEAVAEGAGMRLPRRSLPYAAAWAAGSVSEAWGRLTRRPEMPLLTRAAVQMLGRDAHVSTEWTRRELGWSPEVDYREAVRRFLGSQGAAPTGSRTESG